MELLSLLIEFPNRAGSVHLQTLSPTTKGLFHKAIAQSGSAGPSWSINTVDDARKHTLTFARQVGCDTEDSAVLDWWNAWGVKVLMSWCNPPFTTWWVALLRLVVFGKLLDLPLNYLGFRSFYRITSTLSKDGLNSRPCIEDVKDEEAFLTELPLDILAAGKANRIPLMIGAVSQDGLLAGSGMGLTAFVM